MSIVLNEVKQAEKIIQSGNIGQKPAATLFLLARYYRQRESLSKAQTFDRLNNFMKTNSKNYISALWEEIIENIIKKALQYPLREVDFIVILESELDEIAKLKNMKYQRLVFTMLCYAKLYNIISLNNNGWVNTDIKELYKVSRVSVKRKEDKFLFLNDIEKTGLIKFSKRNDNLNLQVTFISNSSEAILQIYDFRELGYEYMNYIGTGDFVRCQCCNRLIRKKSSKDFSTKYCSECAKQIKNMQNKKYYKMKFRKS